MRRLGLVVGMLGGAILIVLAAAVLAPWPGALLIRWLFERDGARVGRALQAYAPRGVDAITGVRYGWSTPTPGAARSTGTRSGRCRPSTT
jgi:hypothetical protein